MILKLKSQSWDLCKISKPEQMLGISYHTVRLGSVNATSVTAAYIAPPEWRNHWRLIIQSDTMQ